MRSVLFFSALALGTGACAHQQIAAGHVEVATGEPRIMIGERSNICVFVTVDQRVWPRPKTAETDSALSGILTAELRQLYQRGGRSTFIADPGPRPGPRPEPRFANDNGRANPICRDTDEDIYITVSYTPRPDGAPFVFRYRIVQGQTTRDGSESRDLREELRSGRVRFSSIDEPIQLAVAEDVRARAAFILDQIS